jgi:hypothetical protein
MNTGGIDRHILLFLVSSFHFFTFFSSFLCYDSTTALALHVGLGIGRTDTFVSFGFGVFVL